MIRNLENLSKQVFQVNDEKAFEELALDIFRLQSECNPVYKAYVKSLGINSSGVQKKTEIPFLPIEFFKHHKILLEGLSEEIIFSSSGTTGMVQSKHYVSDLNLYETSFKKAFELFFGNPQDYCVLALLPSYLEREGSSLIFMVEHLIKLSGNPKSGFFLNNLEELIKLIHSPELKNTKVLLLGVSFALLDLAEKHQINHPDLVVMETGGMKGRRKEMIREELHLLFCERFDVAQIHSEYGMTELLSQAYSKSEGRFYSPPWMKVLIRDANDPFSYLEEGKSGGINIIDLANINSCSFLMTQDLGKIHPDASFEILGRFDASDIRGCNLLIQ